jgi:VWFA-related protein
MSQQTAARRVIVIGLFIGAAAWVMLMGLVAQLGQGRAGAAPRDDGSVKADVTSLDRQNFAVNLSLKVTDKSGQVVNGLKEQDIEVYENGDPVVDIRKFIPAGQGPVRLGMVLDYSASMNRGGKIQATRLAARALLRMLRDQTDYVGLYFFNDALQDQKAEERLPMAPLDLLRREMAWETITFTGLANGSPMLETSMKALDALSKVSGRRVILLLTDGMETGEKDEIEKNKKLLIERCNDLGVPLYTVNMSTEFSDEVLLRDLAEKTQGQYFSVPKPEDLKGIFESIGSSLQNEYTISYETPNPIEDGTKRNVVVNVRSRNSGTQAKKDYQMPGVVAAGVGSKRSSGMSSRRDLTSLATVFLPLGMVMGFLFCAPSLVRWRARHRAESAAAAEKATTPAAVPVAPARSKGSGKFRAKGSGEHRTPRP